MRRMKIGLWIFVAICVIVICVVGVVLFYYRPTFEWAR